jgi:hypothetical protein
MIQLLHASAHGKFRTSGRYSDATVLGTIWTVTARCDGTLTYAIKESRRRHRLRPAQVDHPPLRPEVPRPRPHEARVTHRATDAQLWAVIVDFAWVRRYRRTFQLGAVTSVGFGVGCAFGATGRDRVGS